jgi:ectoine hydroxylase
MGVHGYKVYIHTRYYPSDSKENAMSVVETKLELKKLTHAQLADFEQNGFVVVPDVFPPEDLQVIDRELDRIIDGDKGQDRDGVDWSPRCQLMLGLRSGLMRQVAEDPRILTVIEDIVKPGIAVYGSKMVAKVPHDEQVCHWHQDDAYFSQNSQSRTRLSVWIGLQDADSTNGGVWFLPGSHKTGLRKHAPKKTGQCKLSFDPVQAEIAGAVCPPVKAGSLVLFNALTWHSSGPNPSDRLRRAFIITYQEATVMGGNKDQWRILRSA